MDAIIEKAAQAAAEAVIGRLMRQKLIIGNKAESGKTAFQKTEALLFNYINFKGVIREKQALINELRKNGADTKSKSVVLISTNSEYKNEAELKEEKIEALESSIAFTTHWVEMLESAMESIQDEAYFDIIRMRYFEKLSAEDIAVRIFVDTSTVNRNKRRLVDMLKVRLFSDDVISELMLA